MYNIHLKPSMCYTSLTIPNSFDRIANLELLQILNRTPSYKIRLGRDISTKQEYIVKIFKTGLSPIGSDKIDQEALIYADVGQGHQNILQFVEYFRNFDYIKKNGRVKKVFAFVMELAEEGNLIEHLESGPLAENVARAYFNQLISGMEHMHNHGVVHLNIRPENLILSKSLLLKIANFNFASYVDICKESQSQLELPRALDYAAPELILKKTCEGYHHDIFSCGVILFTMVAGHPPFNQASAQDVYYNLIIRHQFDTFWKQHERGGRTFDKQFKDLINNLLAYEPTERLTIPEIKAHPWVLGEKPSLDDLKVQYEEIKRLQKDSLQEKTSFDSIGKGNKLNIAKNQNKKFYAMHGIRMRKNCRFDRKEFINKGCVKLHSLLREIIELLL